VGGKPLSGIVVLDLSWVYSGPYASLLLHDLGADVIKVEAPVHGDHSRSFPPFRNGASGYFYSLNRGKRSIALDLKNEAGKALFRKLAAGSDVVVENFVPGTMEKLGLGYEQLKRERRDLVYASIHGFGTFGPYAAFAGVDPVAQAMGGLMAQSGFAGGAPLKTGPAVADAIAGLYLAFGIVAAILERSRTGEGKRVEVGMMDAVFSVLEESVVRASITGDALPRRGNTDPLGAPWDAFETSDGKWVMVCAVGGDRVASMYRGIGRDDIARDYGGDGEAAGAKRAEALLELNRIFAGWAKTRTADELMAYCRKLRVPCGEVRDVADLLEDPHLRARGMVVDIEHPRLGKVATYNTPVLFDGQSIGIAPGENPLDPEAGEHGRAILREMLGMDDAEVDRLRLEGAVWA
jgi:crotonobetainyl-CoA:carnitine CoA-transferase CaiB-like acyl-CoA transferase